MTEPRLYLLDEIRDRVKPWHRMLPARCGFYHVWSALTNKWGCWMTPRCKRWEDKIKAGLSKHSAVQYNQRSMEYQREARTIQYEQLAALYRSGREARSILQYQNEGLMQWGSSVQYDCWG